MSYTHQKHPDEVRDMTFNFSNFPEIEGTQTIVSVVGVTSTPAGITFAAPIITEAGKKVVAEASGGTDTEEYLCECVALTSSGKVLVRSLVVKVSRRE